MSYLAKIDKYLDSLKIGKSAIVDSWFMMSSPLPILGVVISYLLFLKIGPRLMKNRRPFEITKLISYYNAAQVVLAVTICLKVFKLNLFKDGIIYAGCRYPSNTQNPLLLDLGWWYFFAKFTELLDSVFFVLKKKNSQLTFLHVYHHVVMALYSWSYLKFAAGGEGAVLALLNSAVHVVMYSYYLLSGLGPKYQKYLWWKKYVTKMQLGQFILMLLYCACTHYSPRCQYAPGFTYFISANVVIFLFLFLNFYSKSYRRKNGTKCQEYETTCTNSTNNNHTNKLNGTKQKCEKFENGFCTPNCLVDNDFDNVAHEVTKACGDYVKNGKVYLTRRSAKAAYGPDFNYESIIAK
ncbi:elongation of very long chain fatty acids protein 7-like [Leptidea sinapis]|uniref:elongation of very long chain fatty acids protein 7-like n=1 Tax=Leptidea sinapis TaxID=189913 RepID=UPI0021311EC9|nr:elongation of very long chain fatty acids protein 7-like [Leptidea sinapis]